MKVNDETKMNVKYSYLSEQFRVEPAKVVDPSVQVDVKAILADITDVLLKTGQFTLGQQVQTFETRFAKMCQTKYGIGVNSGTDALFLVMKALNIGAGDEVITAPNSFIATAGAIANTGARPVFVDINGEYNINPDLIEKAITKRTKAVIPVHLTGNPADMPKILEIAKKHKLHVIEDAAQAANAAISGQSVGSFGIAGCFSLHPLKNLNVWGDGGVITTNSKDLYEKIVLMRNHGLKNRDEVELFGYNSRLDTLQSIVAGHVLDVLDVISAARIRNAGIYDQALSGLSDKITVPPRKKNVKQVYHTYVIQAQDRDRLAAYLEEKGIEAKVHYPIPIHLQQASKYLGYKQGDFPVCEEQTRMILTLPVHQHLTRQEIDYVISHIRKFYSV